MEMTEGGDFTIEELKALLTEKSQLIKALEAKVADLELQNQQITEQFATSTNFLIERLKREEQAKTGQRPQTAQLLAQSRFNLSADESTLLDSSDADYRPVSTFRTKPAGEPAKCHCCGKMFPMNHLKRHTIECFRAVIKCKACGELMMKADMKQHLEKYRDLTKLKDAAMTFEKKVLEAALLHGFKLETPYLDYYGYTLLHIAVETQSAPLIEWLAEKKADPNAQDSDGCTALMLTLRNKQDKLALRLLELFGDANLDLQNKRGETALYIAVKAKLKKCATVLLDKKADASIKTFAGDSVLSAAEKSGQLDLVPLLVGAGATLRPVSAFSVKSGAFRISSAASAKQTGLN